ncbi:zinc-finger double domain-containing protein [Ditylenchus destructor]|nr:zinc-finger double domain-containing protein [Ditylenchus destructor]
MSRNVMKSEIDEIEIDDNEQTKIKQEYEQTSQNIALESPLPELEQNHNAPTIDQILLEAMLDPTDDPALTDCQPTLSSIINQLFDISEESIKEHEVAPNGDVGHLTSINLYPGAVSSAIMENNCEINTTEHFHATSEEVHVSDLSRAIMTTDQASDNEVHTAVDQNASGVITATATSMPIPTEIPPMNRAKVPNKQIGSKVSKPPIALQEPVLDDEMPLKLRLRDRKQINYCDGDSKSSEHDSKKDSHCESNESKVKGNSRPKVRLQLKKKCQIGNLRANVGPKRAVDGEMRHKCKQCQYATNNKSHFTEHMRTHTGERPFKCKTCKYAAAHQSTLIQHERIHTGEKPYKCQFCKFAAAHRSNLTEHERTHSGEKPYKCQFCKFATAHLSNLTKHIRIHTGEKPYKCRFCQFASRYGQSLNTHMRTQHKDALKLDAANNKINNSRNKINTSDNSD